MHSQNEAIISATTFSGADETIHVSISVNGSVVNQDDGSGIAASATCSYMLP